MPRPSTSVRALALPWTGLLLGALVAGPWSAAAAAVETIPVPGGTQAVARLVGSVDESPDRFVHSLNHVLLSTMYVGNRWESHDLRRHLAHYLEDLEGLEGRFSSRIEIGLEPKALRKRFRELCDYLGYKQRFKKKRLTLIAAEGDDAIRRQRLANALGWDLPAIAAGIGDGERRVLEIPRDEVVVPLSLRRWQEALDRPVPPETALWELTRSQALSLVLAGAREVPSSTLEVLDRIGWRWLYQHAAPQLYRYAPMLRVDETGIRLPGGAGAVATWAELVEEDPAEPATFLKAALKRASGKAAFLWHSLAFSPQPVVEFYLGGAASRRPPGRFVKKLFKRLDETSRRDFDMARGGELGFGVFVRSVPLSPRADSLALPGGLGLWFVAIRDEELPTEESSVERLVSKGRKKQLEEDDFLLKSLDEQVKVRGVKQPVLPRLIRTSRMFGGRTELLTPENVVLLARASDIYPSVLEVLDDLVLEHPETVESYLLAVAHLDRLEQGPATEVLTVNFQGGVEWLRWLGRAGRVAAPVLEEHLERWARLHRRHADPLAAVPQQLEWIDSLLGELPPAESESPGRGPLERALILSLVGARDPQSFSWQGLDYRGRRARDLAARIAEHLERQRVPSADDVHALARGFAALESACAAGEPEPAHRAAAELRRLVGSLGGAGLEEKLPDENLRTRLLPVDRAELDRLLQRIAKQRKPKRLRRQAETVDAARRLLARELRPFLLSAAYVTAMGENESVLIDDPNLIRKHLFFPGSPWRRARVERPEGSELGAHLSGHLGSLPEALSGYVLIGGGGGGAEHPYRSVFYDDFVNTRWQELTVERTSLVASLVAAGREVEARALAQLRAGAGSELEFVAARVPYGRLERRAASDADGRLLSPSEQLMIGLAALDGDDHAAPERLDLGPALAAAFAAARSAAGADWRAQLNIAGTATPRLNGRSAPWVGTWPPYELLATESRPEALWERMKLDLKVVVLDYLGRNSLPGIVGRDLMAKLLPEASSRPRLASWRDWEGYVDWLTELEDADLEEALRLCLRQGLYELG